jgi:uncharacterized protein (DUF58 family)
MIRPGPRLLAAAAAASAPALLAVWWPPAGFLALGAALGVLLLAAGEARWLGRVRLLVQRAPRSAVALGRPVSLPLQLRHDARTPLVLTARCLLADHLGGGSASMGGICAQGSTLELALTAHAQRRGEVELPPVVVAWTRWGLVERIAAVGASVVVAVLPDLTAVRRLRHRLDALFLRGMGTRLAPRVGQGREFDRLREYVQGDDFRHLAWKASARRGQLIVREFRVERSQDVLLCVDAGHRMAARVAGPDGWLTRTDHAVNAAVLTAWLCNRCEDRVGLLSFAAEVDQGIGQGRGAAHLAALTAFATGIGERWLHTDYRALAAHLRRRLRHRTLVLIATVLPEPGDHADLLVAVRMLVPRHLPLVLVLTDPVLEAAAASQPDDRAELCRTLVAADLVDGRRQLVRELRQLGALVIETTPEDLGVQAINGYLEVKRRQLL